MRRACATRLAAHVPLTVKSKTLTAKDTNDE